MSGNKWEEFEAFELREEERLRQDATSDQQPIEVDTSIGLDRQVEIAPTEDHEMKFMPNASELVQESLAQAVGGQGLFDGVLGTIQETKDRMQVADIVSAGRVKVWRRAVKANLEVAVATLEKGKYAQLKELERQHVENMRQIGLSAEEARLDTLVQLLQVSSRAIEKLQKTDAPDKLKAEVYKMIKDGFHKVAKELSTDVLSS